MFSQAALAIAAKLTGSDTGSDPVIDLGVYQRHIDEHKRTGGV